MSPCMVATPQSGVKLSAVEGYISAMPLLVTPCYDLFKFHILYVRKEWGTISSHPSPQFGSQSCNRCCLPPFLPLRPLRVTRPPTKGTGDFPPHCHSAVSCVWRSILWRRARKEQTNQRERWDESVIDWLAGRKGVKGGVEGAVGGEWGDKRNMHTQEGMGRWKGPVATATHLLWRNSGAASVKWEATAFWGALRFEPGGIKTCADMRACVCALCHFFPIYQRRIIIVQYECCDHLAHDKVEATQCSQFKIFTYYHLKIRV